MLRNAIAWIRRHPVRCAVYALLVGGAVWGALTARGILQGEQNDLLTRVARASWLRNWVDREFQIRYSIDALAIVPKCGYEIDVNGVTVDLAGAASGSLDDAKVCTSGSGELHGIRVGNQIIGVQSAQFNWPTSITGAGFAWRDAAGTLVTADAFRAAPGALSGSLQGLRVPSLPQSRDRKGAQSAATIDSVSATLASLNSPALAVNDVEASGVRLDVDPAVIAQAPARLQAAANSLQAMATAVMPLPSRWSATARRLLSRILIAAAVALLLLKLLVTRAPVNLAWRIAAILAPFVAFPLLALTKSWLAIVIAAPLIAIALWALAYRHAVEWQQRWEPAAVDVPSVLLALLLLLLMNWPAISIPPIPAINQVTVAQIGVRDTTATLHQNVCGATNLIHVSVPQANVSNLRVSLEGSALKSLDIQHASASGQVQTPSLVDLRPVQYLPAQWKTTPPITFCAAVAVHNSGAADIPPAACPVAMKSPAVIARAAVDFTGQKARFAADWTGAPAAVSVAGSADLHGAQIDDLHTRPGAPVRIAKASANLSWANAITADVSVDGVEASGASIDHIALNASASMPCSAGLTTVAGELGKTHYSSAGTDVQLDSAAFNIARPDSSRFSAAVHAGRLNVSGPVGASIPQSQFRLEGVTSGEPIPKTFSAKIVFSTAQLGIAGPVRLTGDLWTGDWQLPRQSISVSQQITSRVPPSIGLDLQASGSFASIASPLRANVRADVRIPQLVPDVGPTAIELTDLRIQGAWDAVSGSAPARISSGWSTVKLPEFPSGLQLNTISRLHLVTTGQAAEAPTFDIPQFSIPSIPQETRFRIEGTPQSISVFTDAAEPLQLDNIQTHNLKASLPELKLQSIEVDTSAQVHRAGTAFPVAVSTHLTDASIGTVLTEPLAANVSIAPQSVHFTLNQPLDTGKLLQEVGLAFDAIEPRATLTALQANVTFAGTKLAGLDVTGSVAPGSLAKGANFTVSQQAASSFHVSAPALPNVTVSAVAPAVTATLNGGKQSASFGAELSADLTLASSSQSPLMTQLADAATGLSRHIQQASQVFAAENSSAFPLAWDLEITGGSPTVSFTPDTVAVRANTVIHRIDLGQETIDGGIDLTLGARLVNDHLLLDLNAPADIGALGRRWQLDTPVLLALRKELLPGKGGELFDSAFYSSFGASSSNNPLRFAVGYGDALQFQTGFHGPVFSAASDGLAQAAIRWQPNAAAVDAFGTFSFKGLEAGMIALPNPYLEDRLDGDFRFSTRGFLADRLTLTQLLDDASRVRSLDRVDLAVNVRSAADGAHLPGIIQSETGVTLKPASELLQLLTSGLNLSFPPRAMQYQRMALDFRVQQGQVQTEPVLLTLSGVTVPGVNGLAVDSNIRVMWGRHGVEPAPMLRDLIYTLQRTVER